MKMNTSGNMPATNQGNIQFVNNPSPQLQGSVQSSPTQHSPMSAGNKNSNNPGAESTSSIISKPRLQELVREVDPTVQLDEEVEEILLFLADDFIDTSLENACYIAKHRHAPTVELRDIQLHLERTWNMWIPGFGNEEVRPYKRSAMTEAHRQRMALIRKTLKKY